MGRAPAVHVELERHDAHLRVEVQLPELPMSLPTGLVTTARCSAGTSSSHSHSATVRPSVVTNAGWWGTTIASSTPSKPAARPTAPGAATGQLASAQLPSAMLVDESGTTEPPPPSSSSHSTRSGSRGSPVVATSVSPSSSRVVPSSLGPVVAASPVAVSGGSPLLEPEPAGPTHCPDSGPLCAP